MSSVTSVKALQLNYEIEIRWNPVYTTSRLQRQIFCGTNESSLLTITLDCSVITTTTTTTTLVHSGTKYPVHVTTLSPSSTYIGQIIQTLVVLDGWTYLPKKFRDRTEKPKIWNLYTTPIHKQTPASKLEWSMVDEQWRQYNVAETYGLMKCRQNCEYEHKECQYAVLHTNLVHATYKSEPLEASVTAQSKLSKTCYKLSTKAMTKPHSICLRGERGTRRRHWK